MPASSDLIESDAIGKPGQKNHPSPPLKTSRLVVCKPARQCWARHCIYRRINRSEALHTPGATPSPSPGATPSLQPSTSTAAAPTSTPVATDTLSPSPTFTPYVIKSAPLCQEARARRWTW